MVRKSILAAAVLAAGAGACRDTPSAPEESVSLAKPGAAADLAVSASSPTQIDLVWSDRSTREAGYEVHRSATATGTFQLHAFTNPDVLTYSDARLQPRTQYCYKVRAFRYVRQRITLDAFSTVRCTTTQDPPPPPAAPSNVSVISMYVELHVSWTDNSATEAGFRVERSTSATGPWVLAATRNANITSYVTYHHQARGEELPICYRVSSFNDDGASAPSDPDCTTPPASPSNLAATIVDDHAVDLTWIDNSSVEEGLSVERYIAGQGLTTIATLEPNATRFRDASVTPNVLYTYHVVARKDGGSSSPSNQVDVVIITGPPAPPATVRAVPMTSSSVAVSWTDGTARAEGYRVVRSVDGVDESGPFATVAASEGVSEYGLSDEERTAERRVCYRVTAFNRFGDSAPSTAGCTTPPAAPGVSPLVVGPDGRRHLTWADNSSVEDGYELWILTSEDYYPLLSFPANTTSYTFCCELGEYLLVLFAVKDGGYSDGSLVHNGLTGKARHFR